MVALEREPHNKYDRNAIKVVNVNRLQVGHIKREQAAALAPIMDCGWARLEGLVALAYIAHRPSKVGQKHAIFKVF
jgi:SWI/SNF-related matrix-associated actin-dependent regulator of chromatin subfamily A3